MLDIPWKVTARLVDRRSNARHFGTLRSAVGAWLKLSRDSQALAMIAIDTRWQGKDALLAADIRELAAELDMRPNWA